MIDKTILDNARSIDVIAFLEQHKGFHFRHLGGEYRCTEHTSLAVKSDRLSWYWHSKGIGGYGVIDFLIKIDGYDFKAALAVLADESTATPFQAPTAEIPKALILPEKAKSNRRVFAYLCKTRGIDSKLIELLIQEKKLYEDTKGNAVFVGYDEQGEPRYATLRGTYTDKSFRIDCAGSDKRYCFSVNGNSSRLYIFESAIDSLSHATLENRLQGNAGAYRADNRLSLGGTSCIALAHYLQRHSHIKELVFCFDNDDTGRKRAIRLAREYADKGYYTRLELPTLKDYNEVLLQYRSEQKKQNDWRAAMRDNITRRPRATADPIITVSTVFAGKQTDQEAFIDLIAKKAAKTVLHNNQDIVDNTQLSDYTIDSSEKQNTRKRRTE